MAEALPQPDELQGLRQVPAAPLGLLVTKLVLAAPDYRGWTADQQLRHASYKGLRMVAADHLKKATGF